MVATSRSVGLHFGTEIGLMFRPRSISGEHRAVLLCPGHTAIADAFLMSQFTQLPRRLANDGHVVYASAWGGVSSWGNGAAVTSLNAAHTMLQSDPAVLKDGKVSLYAGSMGCFNALSFALAHPEKVDKIVLVLPAVDLADLHDNRGYGATIDTAYGGNANYLAQLSERNPNTPANREKLSQFPILMHYSTNDTITVPSVATEWGTRVGAEQVSLGAVGHVGTSENIEITSNFLL